MIEQLAAKAGGMNAVEGAKSIRAEDPWEVPIFGQIFQKTWKYKVGKIKINVNIGLLCA